MVLLIVLGTAEALLVLMLLVLTPIEFLTEKLINLWEMTSNKHQELLNKVK